MVDSEGFWWWQMTTAGDRWCLLVVSNDSRVVGMDFCLARISGTEGRVAGGSVVSTGGIGW